MRIVAPLWTDVLPAAALHFVSGVRGKQPSAAPSMRGASVDAVAEMLLALCQPVRKLEVGGWEGKLHRAVQHAANPPSPLTLDLSTLGLLTLDPQAVPPQVLGQLIAARLAAIVEGWQSGRLLALGFSQRQVTTLVHALFEDNPYRKQCLLDIRQYQS